MRIFLLLAALLLVGTSIVVVPSGSAVGTCTSFTDARCGHLACVGYSWSYPDPYYHCQYYVDYPCQYCVPMYLP